jgi:hypothetical protein
MKIRQVGTELFRADGHTDVTQLTVALRNFTNAPKKPLFPYISFSFHCLVFVIEPGSVYGAVRTACLNTIQVNLSL